MTPLGSLVPAYTRPRARSTASGSPGATLVVATSVKVPSASRSVVMVPSLEFATSARRGSMVVSLASPPPRPGQAVNRTMLLKIQPLSQKKTRLPAESRREVMNDPQM